MGSRDRDCILGSHHLGEQRSATHDRDSRETRRFEFRIVVGNGGGSNDGLGTFDAGSVVTDVDRYAQFA